MNEVFDFCSDQKKNADGKPNLKVVDHTNYSSRLPLLYCVDTSFTPMDFLARSL